MNTLDATDDLEAVVASLRSLIADDTRKQVMSVNEMLVYLRGPNVPGKRLRPSRKTLIGWCDSGQVPARYDAGAWTFSLPAIKRWLPTYGQPS